MFTMQKGRREKRSDSTACKNKNMLLCLHLKVYHFTRVMSVLVIITFVTKPLNFRILTQEIKKTTFRDTSLFHFLVALKPLHPCFHPSVMFLLRSNVHNLPLLTEVKKPWLGGLSAEGKKPTKTKHPSKPNEIGSKIEGELFYLN